MRRLPLALIGVLAAACSNMNPSGPTPELGSVPSPTASTSPATRPTTGQVATVGNPDKGFDELGYNRSARIYNGPADGTDKVLDGKVWGDPTYASDHLKMKWTAAWDEGNAESWSDPDGYPDAHIDNQWNGQVPGGSGEVWHYKIKWIGACGATGTPTASGGYCLWGQFDMLLSHGSVDNAHIWDAHANPSGFGN